VTDRLVQRMTDKQIRMATEALQRDAARLARTAALYSKQIEDGAVEPGTAGRLAQDAADVARQAERIDAMRMIADLYRDETPETT
jgi:hypothetical protein